MSNTFAFKFTYPNDGETPTQKQNRLVRRLQQTANITVSTASSKLLSQKQLEIEVVLRSSKSKSQVSKELNTIIPNGKHYDITFCETVTN